MRYLYLIRDRLNMEIYALRRNPGHVGKARDGL